MANTNLQEMVVGGDGAFDAIFHHSTQRWLEHDELDAVLDRQDQPNPPFNITVELLGPGPPFVEGLFSDNYDWTPVNRPRQLNCSSIRLGPVVGCTVATEEENSSEERITPNTGRIWRSFTIDGRRRGRGGRGRRGGGGRR
ncbi:unnamed protein product [Brassica oleracea var. botrytis]|uniref:(rape) hypothetical protein n=1 Tax=Brassica napus TaxID=3708 RepID=A0A816HZT3_BRANA|nr:unnamed protein product [Brassica napus]